MQGVRLFFDECCSKRLARKISEIYKEDYPDLETRHLTDFWQHSTPDGEWIPMLEREKGWIVLTADRGKDPKKEKLPLICKTFAVTHISMTPKLVHAGYREHKQALLCMWPQIVNAQRLPPGTKITLGYRRYVLTDWPCMTIQGQLFEHWCKENAIPLMDASPGQQATPVRNEKQPAPVPEGNLESPSGPQAPLSPNP